MKDTFKISLENSFAAQKTIFELNSERLHHDKDPEIIHQLRLSLKRIRSIQGFMEFVSPSHPLNKKDIDHLDKIFELSGNVRDNQVQLQDLRLLQEGFRYHFKQYESYLSKQIADSRVALRMKIEKYDMEFLDHLHIDFTGFLYSRTEKELKQSYKDILEEKLYILVNTMKKMPDSTKNLHLLRQKVKDYLNLSALLKDGKALKSNANTAHFKSLDHDLGHWHDLINTKKCLIVFFKNNPGLMNKKKEYQLVWLFIEDEISKSREKIDDLVKQGKNSL